MPRHANSTIERLRERATRRVASIRGASSDNDQHRNLRNGTWRVAATGPPSAPRERSEIHTDQKECVMLPMSRAILVMALALTGQAHAQLTVRSGAGTTPAALAPSHDQFRADIDATGARREISWDGTPPASDAPNTMPGDLYNTLSPRGLVMASVGNGTGFQVSGSPSDSGPGQPAAARFGHINASYSAIFQTYTAFRLFTPLGSQVFDVKFFVAGTSIPAVVTGFGAVFADVDQAGTTALQFFDASGTSLGTFAATPSNNGLSFLGASVSGRPTIGRVRVTLGNTAIGPNDNNSSSDIVVMDDFIYGEPREAPLFANGFE